MPSTKCDIEGLEYPLDYEVTHITSGKLIHGTLFQNHILEFFFIEFKNGDPLLFSPQNTALEKKEKILEAIKKRESAFSDSPPVNPPIY